MNAFRRCVAIVRQRGFINFIKWVYARYWFFFKYGIPIEKYSPPGQCDIILHDHHDHAEDYEAISHISFNRMLNNIEWDYDNSCFIDFGSGKGGSFILAMKYGFKKCIGIEHSRLFVKLSNDYINKFQKKSGLTSSEYTVICDDVANFQVPNDANVFYTFNSFRPVVLEKVLQNIEHSLKLKKRNVLFLYFCAIHKDILSRYGYEVIYSEPVDAIMRYDGGNYGFIKRMN
jgi:hypothetical protein